MRIVGLGLSRTGTSSLARALETLGYRTSHFMDGVAPSQWLSRMSGVRPSPSLAEMYREFDAACDIPAACFFREFAGEFPDCLFILTIRPAETWLNSMQRHCERIAASDPLWVSSFGARLHEFVYGSRHFEPSLYLSMYEHHNASVVDTIAAGRLLVYDLCGGAGWPPLCRFLRRPIPSAAFPHFDWIARGQKPTVIPLAGE